MAPIPRVEMGIVTYKEEVVQGLTEACGLSHMYVKHRTGRRGIMTNMQLHRPSR